jgi:hypothetical protein
LRARRSRQANSISTDAVIGKYMRRIRCLFLAVIACIGWADMAAAQACSAGTKEQLIWDNIKNSQNRIEFLDYLKRFPGGCYRDIASTNIRALIDDVPPLDINAQFNGDGAWHGVENAEIMGGDRRGVIELIRFTAKSTDNSLLFLEYACASIGQGQSDWQRSSHYCPAQKSPIQTFAVRLQGELKDFYDLQVSCRTVKMPTQERSNYTVGSEEWCGARRTSRDFNSTAIDALSVTVRRKAASK